MNTTVLANVPNTSNMNTINSDTNINCIFDGLSEEERKTREILQEHYNKVYHENMAHSNPIAWIEAKYCDSNSPYFRREMSEEQRNIAYRNEKRMIETGGKYTAGVARFDYALRKYPELYIGPSSQTGYSRNTDKMKYQERCSINEQLFTLLGVSGIELSRNDNIKLTIDPYSFNIEINGNISNDKIRILEELLNRNNSGKNLWTHVWNCMHDSSNEIINIQGNTKKQQQFALWHEFYNTTGYDIRKVKLVDKKYVMPDGTDILEIFREKTNSAVFDLFSTRFHELVENEWNYADDLELEIGFDSTGLYDIGQTNGFGIKQSGWITNTAIFDARI